MKVLVTASDLRVRRALTGLLESAGYRTAGVAHPADVVPAPGQGAPDLVVLELGAGTEAQDLATVEQLAGLGCPVIAVSSSRTRTPAVLTAGAAACLDEDDPGFADQLTEAVRAVADDRARRGHGSPPPRGTPGLRQRAPSDPVIPPLGRRGDRPQTATQLDRGPDLHGGPRHGP